MNKAESIAIIVSKAESDIIMNKEIINSFVQSQYFNLFSRSFNEEAISNNFNTLYYSIPTNEIFNGLPRLLYDEKIDIYHKLIYASFLVSKHTSISDTLLIHTELLKVFCDELKNNAYEICASSLEYPIQTHNKYTYIGPGKYLNIYEKNYIAAWKQLTDAFITGLKSGNTENIEFKIPLVIDTYGDLKINPLNLALKIFELVPENISGIYCLDSAGTISLDYKELISICARSENVSVDDFKFKLFEMFDWGIKNELLTTNPEETEINTNIIIISELLTSDKLKSKLLECRDLLKYCCNNYKCSYMIRNFREFAKTLLKLALISDLTSLEKLNAYMHIISAFMEDGDEYAESFYNITGKYVDYFYKTEINEAYLDMLFKTISNSPKYRPYAKSIYNELSGFILIPAIIRQENVGLDKIKDILTKLINIIDNIVREFIMEDSVYNYCKLILTHTFKEIFKKDTNTRHELLKIVAIRTKYIDVFDLCANVKNELPLFLKYGNDSFYTIIGNYIHESSGSFKNIASILYKIELMSEDQEIQEKVYANGQSLFGSILYIKQNLESKFPNVKKLENIQTILRSLILSNR